MSTVQSIIDQLRFLIGQANDTTGKLDGDTTTAIASLIAGYGAGGGTDIPPAPSPSGEFLVPVALRKEVGLTLQIELVASNVNVNV